MDERKTMKNREERVYRTLRKEGGWMDRTRKTSESLDSIRLDGCGERTDERKKRREERNIGKDDDESP